MGVCRPSHRYFQRIYLAVHTWNSCRPCTWFVHSQLIAAFERSCSQAFRPPWWTRPLCMSTFLTWAEAFLRPFIRRGEKSWMRFSLLWFSTQSQSLLLSLTQPEGLQEPFAPGSLLSEAIGHIRADPPDPLLVPSCWEKWFNGISSGVASSYTITVSD